MAGEVDAAENVRRDVPLSITIARLILRPNDHLDVCTVYSTYAPLSQRPVGLLLVLIEVPINRSGRRLFDVPTIERWIE